MSAHRHFCVGLPDIQHSQRGQEKSAGTGPDWTCNNQPISQELEEYSIESSTKTIITSNNVGNEAKDTTADTKSKSTTSGRIDSKASKICAIKLPIDFFDSSKIRILYGQKDGSNIVLLYIMLVCLAAKSNRSGALYISDDIPYDINMLASLVHIDAATVKKGIDLLAKYGLIDTKDDVISVVGYSRLVEYESIRRRRKR